MNLILFDHPGIRQNLLPLTFTRPIAAIRIGILTIAEKWEKYLQSESSFSTELYLSGKFKFVHQSDNLWINGAVCPDTHLVSAIQKLKTGDALVKNTMILAVRTAEDEVPEVITGIAREYAAGVTIIDQLWKIFQLNGAQIREDFNLITQHRDSELITDYHTRTYSVENIFLEPGVTLHAAILNAENGPIYLGKNSQVQEGAAIRGPFALCEGSIVGMNAKVRGDTTVGPFSKIGGEVSNSVLFGYSNKSHDGFLGNSVLGEWCNMGADTNTSNLKNNYENIKLWSYSKGGFIDTGLQFCGLIMGDHSKSGINTMFNTGTVVGVSSNIFGSGYPRNFIPSFQWGGAGGLIPYQVDKALETAAKAMDRRALSLTEDDRKILTTIFELTINRKGT